MEMQDADGDERTGDDGSSPWQAELWQGTRLKGAKEVESHKTERARHSVEPDRETHRRKQECMNRASRS